MKREPRRRYRASPLTWGSIGQKMPDWQSSQPRDQGTDATRKPTRPSGWLPGGRRPARRKSLDALPPCLVGNTGHSPRSSPPRICVSARPVPLPAPASQPVPRPHLRRTSNARSLLLADILMPFSQSSFPRAKTKPRRTSLFGGLLCSCGPEAGGSHHASRSERLLRDR